MSVNAMTFGEVRSSLADDPDLRELVELYVSEIPNKIIVLSECATKEDWQELGRYAHQIKGAAGSYGFGQITSFAANLEYACRNGKGPNEILDCLEQLVLMLNKAKV